MTEDFYGVQFVDVFDFDHDGDLEVLAVAPYGVTNPSAPAPSTRNGHYAWLENVNGDGSAWTRHEVGSGFWGVNSVAAADIDGDGDTDLMGTSGLTNGNYTQASDVTWLENSDGKGISWIQHNVDDLLTQMPTDARITDIDGDADFVVTRWNEVLIYENANGDGSQFTRRILTNAIYSNPTVDIGNMDNDGDPDVVVSAPRHSSVRWL